MPFPEGISQLRDLRREEMRSSVICDEITQRPRDLKGISPILVAYTVATNLVVILFKGSIEWFDFQLCGFVKTVIGQEQILDRKPAKSCQRFNRLKHGNVHVGGDLLVRRRVTDAIQRSSRRFRKVSKKTDIGQSRVQHADQKYEQVGEEIR